MLEWQKKEASVSLASKNSVQSGDSDSDEEEESKEPPIKLPKASNWILFEACHICDLTLVCSLWGIRNSIVKQLLRK